MARPKAQFPTPGKRRKTRSWRIFWWGEGHVFEISAGDISQEEAEARRLEIALALRTGAWPEWATGSPTVARYLRVAAPVVVGDVLKVYDGSLRGSVADAWRKTMMGMLRELADFVGGEILVTTPADADRFLARIPSSSGPFQKKRGRRTRRTRNHMLQVFRQFFAWAMRTQGLHRNPFAGIKRLREDDRAEIVHLSGVERDAVLAAADDEPDGVALWLALYAGLRRGEIAAATWSDVHLDRRKLDVPRTKTRRRRTVDLASRLADRLAQVPQSKRRGRVVKWPADKGEWNYQSSLLLRRIAATAMGVAAEKLRWNVFRHTFASLLVQGGVSIFKVASWMGNGIGICQRHYAAMSPEFDADIDRMK